MLDLVGRSFGQYQIVERIGSGGMATVYRAIQPSLKRDVAIKVLPPFLALDPTFVARFRREATAVAALEHPNILPVYDFIEQNDLLLIVMRLVRGGTLRDRIGSLDWRSAARIGALIAGALDYAHRNGVIHRDIKPTNVLMAEGDWPLLTDFGIAQLTQEPGLTLPGLRIGTPEYLSPEQAQGLPADRRSDVYSLGVVLFEMAAGRPPFSGPEHLARIAQRTPGMPPPPSAYNPAIPATFDVITQRARLLDPAARYQTAGEMKLALENIGQATPPPTFATPPPAFATSAIPAFPAEPPRAPPPPDQGPTLVERVPASTPPPARRSSGPGPLVWAALSAAVLFFLIALGGAAIAAVALFSTQPTPTGSAGLVSAVTPLRTSTPGAPTSTPTPRPPTPRPPTAVPPTFTPIPVGLLLFSDNMQANTNGWCVVDQADRQFYFVGGTYHMVNQTTDLSIWCPKTDRTFSSFAFEADIAKVAGPNNWGFGLIFRQNGRDGYRFSIAGDGHYSLSRYVAALEDYDDLIKFTLSDAVRKGDTKNRLKVVARGNEITLYINDFWVAQIRDTGAFAVTSGNIGMYVGPGVHMTVNAVRVFAVS